MFVCLLLLLLLFFSIIVFGLFVFSPALVMSRKKVLPTNEPRSRSSLFALISTVFVGINYNHKFFYFILFFLTVPFRDSVLTKLLKNALGGNSKTIMVSSAGSSSKSVSKDRGQQ